MEGIKEMSVKIRALVFMFLLVMLSSGIVYGDRTLKPSYSASGEVIPGEYIPDTFDEHNPNLLIGGIRENSSDPDENQNYKDIAKQLGAIYVPTYYSGTSVNSGDEIKKTLGDALEVNNAASSDKGYTATYQNGLKDDVLNGKTYDTIIAYSGGTTSAATALDHQNVKCHTLILISPMIGCIGNPTIFKNQIKDLFDNGVVQRIVVIQSDADQLPVGNFYQARFQAGEITGVDIYPATLTTTGIQAHIDLFFNYAKNHLRRGENGRVYYQPNLSPTESSGNSVIGTWNVHEIWSSPYDNGPIDGHAGPGGWYDCVYTFNRDGTYSRETINADYSMKVDIPNWNANPITTGIWTQQGNTIQTTSGQITTEWIMNVDSMSGTSKEYVGDQMPAQLPADVHISYGYQQYSAVRVGTGG